MTITEVPGMRRRLRHAARQLLAVAGTLALAGMALTATAPAQASAASGSAAWPSSAVKAAPWAKMAKAAAGTTITPDTRSVCGAVKAGYSTCMAVMRTNVRHYKGLLPASAPPEADGYGPAQLRSAYDLPSATAGAGETVAIVDAYDDPTAEADLQVYRASYHLPVCDTANGCFEKVNQDGLAAPLPAAAGDAGPGSFGWDAEESLDVDMVSAICPQCHILLVEANSDDDDDLYHAEDTAVALGAKFVSNSWSGVEYPGETADDVYFDHPGVAITAATGDDSYGTLYPAASRYVTAVGGTTLVQDSRASRGWEEYAWSGGGSGCSIYEPKPAWQKDTGCPNRTEADVSAIADPDTGVAVYDSYSGDGASTGGWGEFGGTSVATPIIAATYALAGLPAAGSNPASYPYARPSDLHDITEGTNSPVPCGSPADYYLCLAGPGYNGPTGLGTPDGVRAFSGGVSSGTISGKVSVKVSGKSSPVAGATVTAGGDKTTTGPDGEYVMAVPDGSYTVSAAAFGYQTAAIRNVRVEKSKITAGNVTVSKVPRSVTVSGTVSDGSGHRWPVYASIGISGHTAAAAYTNPYTGHYSLTLPEQGTYTLTVTPRYPGYATATAQVSVPAANVTRNIDVTADPTTCTAPGYSYHYAGDTETFTGWSTTPEDGWTVVDNEGNGEVWSFDNRTDLPPPPGGDADFASIDPNEWGGAGAENTSLVSPVFDLSKDASPVITFDSAYGGGYDVSADVDLSVNGGKTWTTVWEQTNFGTAQLVTVPIPQAAGKSDVQVRFHYTQTLANPDIGTDGPWEVDNVFVGTLTCPPTPGGLVTGVVTDGNTGKPVDEATVTSDSAQSQSGTSAAAPGLSGGYYWLFASPGSTQLTASDGNYAPSTQTVNVAANAITVRDWTLQAGQFTSVPGSLSVTRALGSSGTTKLQFLDTGTKPVQVQVSGQSSGFTPMGVKAGDEAAVRGAPLERVKGNYSPLLIGLRNVAAKGSAGKNGTADGIQLHAATPSGTAWAPIADYPIGVDGNAVGYDPATGSVYSAGGISASTGYLTTNSYVYNPLQQQWSAIAPLPVPLAGSAGAFAGGKFYMVGGLVGATDYQSALGYAYDPASDSWSQIADLPIAVYGASAAVLNNTLYVIGGCTAALCLPGSDGVYEYNASANRWITLATYPMHFAWGACAGIDDEIVCAGGVDTDTDYSSTATYIYHPATNTWSQGAAMPYDNWGMDYAGAGNKLQVFGGVTEDYSLLTNQAAEYDPATNTWSTLPYLPEPEYEGGGSCGLYQVGGIYADGGDSDEEYSQFGDVLPGYDQCGTGTIPWLSTSTSSFTIQPGQAQTVTVKTDSASVGQPGTYTAQLAVEANTPYQIQPIAITMTVNPPSTWSEVKGTVTDASTGKPLSGATVQVCAKYDTSTGACGSTEYTLTTDSSGDYTLWLNRAYNPLQIIAATLGYAPAAKVADLVKGAPVTVNFALSEIP
jgi:N-acetylneuraminic acid mutarotase